MKSELDKIKSTITLSLGTKNRLRKLKGNLTYEEFINKLLRSKNEIVHSNNYIEVQKFIRKDLVYSSDNLQVVFSFNQYNYSPNFIFDIKIKSVRENGKRIISGLGFKSNTFPPAYGFESNISHPHFGVKSTRIYYDYKIYFDILTLTIQNEIDIIFKHKGRWEDYDLWKIEFEKLGLSKNAFENDVMEKLDDYISGIEFKW